MKKNTVLLARIILALGAAGTSPPAWAADPKPNIVLIYIDDWAWNGTPVAMDDTMPNSRMPVLRMPRLEKLASEGMKFRNAYASPQCSPARACVQTGQSSPRNGYTVFMNNMGQDYYNDKKSKGLPVIGCISDATLDPGTTTIPEALKPLGYVSAHIGKWHLRGNPGDEGYVLHDGDTTNTPGNTLPEDGNKRIPDDMTDPKRMFSITGKAIGFMEEQAKAEKPFYLQISHYAMHAGSECLPSTRAKYLSHPEVQAYYKREGTTADKVNRKQDPAVWLGMGEDLDGRIGAVLDKIESLGIADRTYVIVVSDNGYRHQFLPGLAQPLHAHKWWLWQGGIRVPMIVRGPGIEPGSVFQANVVNYDFLPTFVEWAGGDPGTLSDIDGVSLAPYLRGRAPDDAFLHRPLYFHYPHNRSSMPHSAIVSGSKKVIHFYQRPDIPMLFDLEADEAETTNLAGDMPEEHRRLFAQMTTYLSGVKARIPKLNPDYKPADSPKGKANHDLEAWGPFAGQRPPAADEFGANTALDPDNTPLGSD